MPDALDPGRLDPDFADPGLANPEQAGSAWSDPELPPRSGGSILTGARADAAALAEPPAARSDLVARSDLAGRSDLAEGDRPAEGGPTWAGPRASRPDRSQADVVDIGFVNNMPDAGLEASERQFRALLDRAAAMGQAGPRPSEGPSEGPSAGASAGAGAGAVQVRMHLFSLPGIPRGPRAAAYLRRLYGDFDRIRDCGLDALIVTGSEPRADDLRAEPYWDHLAALLDWAEAGGVPTVLSCLAAHAAVLHRDGIVRRRLPGKCSGVFAHAIEASHPLMRGVAAPLAMPHSRWNELAEADLVDHGYTVLSRSATIGVDLFMRQRRGLTLLFQGHPEYEPTTLLREYKRDVRRFLDGIYARYPALPEGCLDAAGTARMAAFQARAEQRGVGQRGVGQRGAGQGGAAEGGLMAEFPDLAPCFARIGPDAPTAHAPSQGASSEGAPWQAPAARLWRNWLAHVHAHRRGG